MEYQVIVGGLGAIYVGSSRRRAARSYRRAVARILSGRLAWSDTVTLFSGGAVWKEFDAGLVRLAAHHLV